VTTKKKKKQVMNRVKKSTQHISLGSPRDSRKRSKGRDAIQKSVGGAKGTRDAPLNGGLRASGFMTSKEIELEEDRQIRGRQLWGGEEKKIKTK